MLLFKAQSIYLTTLFFSMYRMSREFPRTNIGDVIYNVGEDGLNRRHLKKTTEKGAVIINQLIPAPSAERIIPELYRAKNALQTSRVHS